MSTPLLPPSPPLLAPNATAADGELVSPPTLALIIVTYVLVGVWWLCCLGATHTKATESDGTGQGEWQVFCIPFCLIPSFCVALVMGCVVLGLGVGDPTASGEALVICGIVALGSVAVAGIALFCAVVECGGWCYYQCCDGNLPCDTRDKGTDRYYPPSCLMFIKGLLCYPRTLWRMRRALAAEREKEASGVTVTVVDPPAGLHSHPPDD